jgi:hypothetical protein
MQPIQLFLVTIAVVGFVAVLAGLGLYRLNKGVDQSDR